MPAFGLFAARPLVTGACLVAAAHASWRLAQRCGRPQAPTSSSALATSASSQACSTMRVRFARTCRSCQVISVSCRMAGALKRAVGCRIDVCNAVGGMRAAQSPAAMNQNPSPVGAFAISFLLHSFRSPYTHFMGPSCNAGFLLITCF